jgi:hypothetical protein
MVLAIGCDSMGQTELARTFPLASPIVDEKAIRIEVHDPPVAVTIRNEEMTVGSHSYGGRFPEMPVIATGLARGAQDELLGTVPIEAKDGMGALVNNPWAILGIENQMVGPHYRRGWP